MIKVIFVAFIASSCAQLHAASCKDSIIPMAAVEASGSKEVAAYLKAIQGTVFFADDKVAGSYCRQLAWYEERMPSRRLSSRMLALLVIILGASLPLISLLDSIFKNQKFWVAFVGGSIVVVQGFAQTFQFEESWRNFTVAKLELEAAHRDWQMKIVEAGFQTHGLPLAQNAIKDFQQAVSNIMIKETTGFFDSLSLGAKGPLGQNGQRAEK